MASFFCFGQDSTHTFIGAASNETTISSTGENYSWSIGEVVVFNDINPNPTIAQAMQSYPPFVPVKNCPLSSLGNKPLILCNGASFTQKLTYTATFPIANNIDPAPDSVQWFYGDGIGFTKIAGATSLSSKDYQPYFPGQYKVRLKYNTMDCPAIESNIVTIENFTSSFAPPVISESGSPVNLLSASVSGSPTSIQWYVSVNGKYLMIAGGVNGSQKIRYKGEYMVVATYGTCRLSGFHTVGGNLTAIQRAEDVTYDANTIYIPDEMAFSESTLKIYPNPASGQFFVQFQSSTEITTDAQLFSNTGVLVKEIEFTEGSTWLRSAHVNTDDLSTGVYFLKVNQEGKSMVEKVVIYK